MFAFSVNIERAGLGMERLEEHYSILLFYETRFVGQCTHSQLSRLSPLHITL